MEKNGIECFQLQGPYSNHLAQLSHHFRADRQSKDVIKGVVQTPVKQGQAGAGLPAFWHRDGSDVQRGRLGFAGPVTAPCVDQGWPGGTGRC